MRRMTGEAAVEDRAAGPRGGEGSALVVSCLFRGNITRRPDEASGPGLELVAPTLRDAEVEELRHHTPLFAAQEDIVRLHVPVDDASSVRGDERLRDGNDDGDGV